jgi:hypothetical protein
VLITAIFIHGIRLLGGSFGLNDGEDGFALNCKLVDALENVAVEVVQVDG